MAETTHTGQRRNKLSWTAEFFTVSRSIRQPYNTFKFPRGDMDTPPRHRNFFRYLAIGMCHFRRLWNGMCDRHRAEITVMQFTGHSLPVHHFVTTRWDFFTLSHIVSQAVFYRSRGRSGLRSPMEHRPSGTDSPLKSLCMKQWLIELPIFIQCYTRVTNASLMQLTSPPEVAQPKPGDIICLCLRQDRTWHKVDYSGD